MIVKKRTTGFKAAGFFFILVALVILENTDFAGFETSVLLAFIPVAIASLLFFYRNQVVFDGHKVSATFIKGSPILGKEEEVSLSSYTSVSTTLEKRNSGKRSYTIYPVRFLSEGSGSNLHIVDAPDSGSARTLGEELADLFKLPLVDTATGVHLERSPETLNMSLKERYLHENRKLIPAKKPVDCHCSHSSEGLNSLIKIDKTGLNGGNIFVCAIGFIWIGIVAGIGGAIIAEDGFRDNLIPVYASSLIILGLLPMLFFVLSGLRSAYSRYEIVVSPTTFSFISFGPIFSLTHSIPIVKLEELEIVQKLAGRGLVHQHAFISEILMARSDEKTIGMGQGLGSDELLWVKYIVESAICNSSHV